MPHPIIAHSVEVKADHALHRLSEAGDDECVLEHVCRQRERHAASSGGVRRQRVVGGVGIDCMHNCCS